LSAESSGDPHVFEIDWGTSPNVCTRVTVYKFYDAGSDTDMNAIIPQVDRTCSAGAECVVFESRGYNRSCSDLVNPRTVERALRIVQGGIPN
jgi:hypothetical protein